MLHRAAGNAYSWWWASHIRTKQSKWLDNNLQDVEVKVETVLKLIEEDGDSFAQKAEMYYRKRPELVKFVEDFYRAYRALAERYDHISGELHKANKTLATVFPDQLQQAIADGEETAGGKNPDTVFQGDGEDEESEGSSSAAAGDPVRIARLRPPGENAVKVKSSAVAAMAAKQPQLMNREKAQEEVDKLLKGILILQTEKEFIKSGYETNLAKYWDIEKRMTEMQREVCSLQDQHSVTAAIEDDEARALMAATALKTCEAALVGLQEQQKQSMEEASLASDRIRVSRGRLRSLKAEETSGEVEEPSFSEMTAAESPALAEEKLELQTICEKIKEHFEKASVEELAEKIDELAEKIIGMEVAAASQTAQIRRLRTEADELQMSLQRLEEEKADLEGLSEKLKDVEEELAHLQSLERSVRDEGQNLRTDISIACRSFVDLSEGLHSGDGGCAFQQEHQRHGKDDDKEEDGIKASADESDSHDPSRDRSCASQHEHQRHAKDDDEEDDGIKTSVDESDSHDPSGDRSCASQHEHQRHGKDDDEEEDGIKASVVESDSHDPSGDRSCASQHEHQRHGVEEEQEQEQEERIKASCDESSVGLGLTKEAPSPMLESGSRDLPETLQFENGSCSSPEEGRGGEGRADKADDSADSRGLMEMKREDEKDKATKKKDLATEDRRKEKACETCPTPARKEEEEEERSLNWQQLLLNGLEGREKLLLNEYTSILRNYKETKRKLIEAEKRHQQHLSETMARIRDLKHAGAAKDEEIFSLRAKLRFLEDSPEFPETTAALPGEMKETKRLPSFFADYIREESFRRSGKDEGGSEDGFLLGKEIELRVPKEPETPNAVEERFRRDIDGLLEENLEFWLRFSASFQQIQKLQEAWQGLQAGIQELSGGGGGDAEALYKSLEELKAELQAWEDENAELKAELQCRFSSLGEIKEEMSKMLAESAGAENAPLTAHRAAKFHGEVLSMQQENNKVAEELQAALGHAKAVEAEMERALAWLRRSLGIVSPAKAQPHYHFRHFSGRTRIPLRSFLFGAKPKKPSIFSCMNPALQKQYSDLTAGLHH